MRTRITRRQENDDIFGTYLCGKNLRNGRGEILRRKCESSRLIEPAVKGSTWLISEKYFTAYNTSPALLISMNIFRKYKAEEGEKEEMKQDCKVQDK